jgi:hypothetical protein
MFFIRMFVGCLFRLIMIIGGLVLVVVVAFSISSANNRRGQDFSSKALGWIPGGHGETFEGWARAAAEKISSQRGGPSAGSSSPQAEDDKEPTAVPDNRPEWSVTLDTGSFNPPEGASCTPGAEYVQAFKILNGGKNDWEGAVLKRMTGTEGQEQIPETGTFTVPSGGSALIEYKVVCSPGTQKITYQLLVGGEEIGKPMEMP